MAIIKANRESTSIWYFYSNAIMNLVSRDFMNKKTQIPAG